jgi:hypothetical protein
MKPPFAVATSGMLVFAGAQMVCIPPPEGVPPLTVTVHHVSALYTVSTTPLQPASLPELPASVPELPASFPLLPASFPLLPASLPELPASLPLLPVSVPLDAASLPVVLLLQAASARQAATRCVRRRAFMGPSRKLMK